MKVLYVGGTGEISLACVERSVELGHQVTIFNRGQRNEAVPGAVQQIAGDLRDDETYAQLREHQFDVVCQFLVYDTETAQRDIEVFSQHCAQYVFISTASAYRKPPRGQLVTEDTPLENPHWAYSRSKAACESLLKASFERDGMPVTVVRPSHTYRTRFPSTIIDGDHLAWRMLNDKPVLVHDQGDSLWTLTHADDFARAFTRLLGRTESIGNAYHITHDDAPSWHDILQAVGKTLDAEPVICPVASSKLIEYVPALEGPLLGDKANSMQFDNRKIRDLIGPWQCDVSLSDGLARVGTQVRARLNSGYLPDEKLDTLIDEIIADRGLRPAESE